MGAFSAESPKFFIGMPRRHGTPHLGPNSESPQESPFATYLALLHNRSFSLNNSVVEVLMMVLFGMIGYVLRKAGYDMAPFVLEFVLGPIFETNFRNHYSYPEGISIYLYSFLSLLPPLLFFLLYKSWLSSLGFV